MKSSEILRRAKEILLKEGHDPFYCLALAGQNRDWIITTKAMRFFVLNHRAHQERNMAADLDYFDRAIALAEQEEG